jgi:sugar lactone lactonase YvrE
MAGRGPKSVPIIVLIAVALVCAVPSACIAQAQRKPFDVRVFAEVPAPGFPEETAVGPDGTVYTGTFTEGKGDHRAPSKIFAFTPEGRLLRDYTIQGQTLDGTQGITDLAFDAEGTLYALDQSPQRVITLDPGTGRQSEYARFRDVPSCAASAPGRECSRSVADFQGLPDFSAFGPDGSLYVTDFEQALIWRVPKGGGRPEIWLTDPRFDTGQFGISGIQFAADGRSLLVATFGSLGLATATVNGKLYRVPVHADGTPGELSEFWQGQPLDFPDGLAIAQSGAVYVALSRSNQLVKLSPEGKELTRIPATEIDNQLMEVPFDTPEGVTFDGSRLLVANNSFVLADQAHSVIFDVFAGEPGLAPFRPVISTHQTPRPSPRIRLTVRPRTARVGRRTVFRFRATVYSQGMWRAVSQASILFAGIRRKTNRSGRARIVKTFTRAGRHSATARKRRLRAGTATVRVLPSRGGG